MRDQFAPMIEGFDLNGIVDPYSFQCTPFYIEGDNGGTLMDGTTIHDILEEKVRLSWTFNALYLNQYTALSDALNSGESPDTVTVYAYDLTRNAVILAKFHTSMPEFNFMSAYGQTMALSNGELVLEEAELLGWFVIKPPTRKLYSLGESLDLTGFTVMQYDKDGNGVNITAQCSISAAESTELMTEGEVPVSALVTVPGRFVWALSWLVTVTSAAPIDSGSWWTFFSNGLLYIYCTGDMPFANPSDRPWALYITNITSVIFSDSVTSISTYTCYRCSKLTSVTIPASVTKMGSSVFENCSSLTNVTIPASVTSFGGYMFEDCYALTDMTIPDGVTSIGANTFYLCHSLTSVTIPTSVTSIGAYAFSGCQRLSDVYYSGTNSQRKSILISTGNNLLKNATWHYESTGPDS